MPTNVRVTSATSSSVSLAWDRSTDNVGVVGYHVYVGSTRVTTGQPSATMSGLVCGTTYAVAIDAYDAAGNASTRANVNVSTAACGDTQPPTSPTALRQQATTEDAVVLAWDPSADNVGVVAYGVYRGGLLVQSPTEPTVTISGLVCNSVYQVAVDAADAAGNRSQPSSAWIQTAACSDRQAPTTPTNLAVTSRSTSSITLAWSPSSDNVGVSGYGLYRNGARVGSSTTTSATFSGLTCNTTYSLAVDAVDAVGNRSQQAQVSSATATCPSSPPPGTTIQPGQSWDAAFDAAAPGTTLLVAAGEHGNQFVTGDRAGTVTFQAQAGAHVGRLRTTASSVVYRDLDMDSFCVEGGSNTKILGGDVGPSTNNYPCVGYTQAYPSRPQDVLIDGVYFHDHDSTSGVHTECLNIGSAVRLTVRDSTFRNCASTASVHVAQFNGALNQDVVIENNFFYPNTGASVEPYGNIQYERSAGPGLIIRYNTFYGSRGISVLATNDYGTPYSSQIYGNLANAPGQSQPNGYGTCDSLATYHHNVWRGASCSSTDKNVSSIGVVSLTTNLHLASGSPAIDAGDSGSYPAGDIDGDARSASPDAGADETSTTASASESSSDSVPPSQPSGLAVASSTATSVSLTWTASSDNLAVAGYGVYVNGTRVQTPTQPAATVSALACGTAYTLEVDAYDAAGNRSAKASIVGTTAACTDAQAPTAPSNVLTTSRTSSSISLSWSPSSDNVGVVGYGLYRGGSLVGTTTSTNGIFSSLACDTMYNLAVDAYDAAGNRSQKTAVTVQTTACPDTSAPTAPTGLAATNVTQTGLVLTWNASSDNVAVTGYDVYRNGTKVGTVTSTSSSQSGLACGTSYTFGVVAFDAAGNRSSQVQLTASSAACSTAPAPSGAMLGVSTTGSDSTCVRGDLSKPCATFNRAYALAQCGDLVSVKAGSYPDQDIVDTARSCPSAPVAIRAEPGTQPVVRKLQLGAERADWGFSTDGPDDLTLSGFKLTWGLQIYSDAKNIIAEKMDGGSFLVAGNMDDQSQGPDGITIRDSDWGPCTPSGTFQGQYARCRTVFEDSTSGAEGQNQIAHGAKNVLIEHNTVHDFIIDVAGVHWECFWVNGGQNITWRANKLWNCETTVWSIGEHSGALLTGTWYIENNWVGRSINDGTSLNFTQYPYNGNVIVRFNSFGPMQASGGEEAQWVDNGTISYVGNIFGQIVCLPGAVYRYNISVATGGTPCGDSTNTRTGSFPYVNSDRYASMDYHLAGSSNADGYVPATAPFSGLAVDFDEQARSTQRDAGSDEH